MENEIIDLLSAQKERNENMIKATQRHFNLHFMGLREGVCVYYHRILENRKFN